MVDLEYYIISFVVGHILIIINKEKCEEELTLLIID
jgi:hypothetical protein